MNRATWSNVYRDARANGIHRSFRHAPAIQAEASRLRSIGALADVARAERLALVNRFDFINANVAKAAGPRVGSNIVATSLNLAADARRYGGRAIARQCVMAARHYRLAS